MRAVSSGMVRGKPNYRGLKVKVEIADAEYLIRSLMEKMTTTEDGHFKIENKCHNRYE